MPHTAPLPAILRAGPWLVYGPTGVTGRLVVEEALRRGQRPLLAGRGESVRAMAAQYGLDAVVVRLDQRIQLEQLLKRVSRVLLVAGPFAETVEPMLAACLATATPYVDVSGEVDSLASVLSRDAQAKQSGIPLIAGAGFGVAAGECLALHVARQLPSARALRIGVQADNRGLSHGALLSTLEVMKRGGAWIADGKLVRGRVGHQRFQVSDGGKARTLAAVPMAEALAAHHSTKIPEVVAGQRVPRLATRLLVLLAPVLRWLAGSELFRRVAKAMSRGRVQRSQAGRRSWIWAEARSATERKAAVLELGEGYAFAAEAMVRAAERVGELAPGAFTPGSAFGPDFVLELSHLVRRDLTKVGLHDGARERKLTWPVNAHPGDG